ncbi:MAG: hypothetical protein D6723_19235 [Acidobacteria bacterium]|nr:MAG: hypothetical protein D6723_19235 [Acidobacteriota bacterium]
MQGLNFIDEWIELIPCREDAGRTEKERLDEDRSSRHERSLKAPRPTHPSAALVGRERRFTNRQSMWRGDDEDDQANWRSHRWR